MTLISIESEEVKELNAFLTEFEERDSNLNRVVSLSALLYKIDDNDLLQIVVNFFGSRVSLDDISSKNVSLEEMKNKIDQFEIGEEYWQKVSKCLDFKNAVISEIEVINQLSGALGKFNYLIEDRAKGEVLFLYGEIDD